MRRIKTSPGPLSGSKRRNRSRSDGRGNRRRSYSPGCWWSGTTLEASGLNAHVEVQNSCAAVPPVARISTSRTVPSGRKSAEPTAATVTSGTTTSAMKRAAGSHRRRGRTATGLGSGIDGEVKSRAKFGIVHVTLGAAARPCAESSRQPAVDRTQRSRPEPAVSHPWST